MHKYVLCGNKDYVENYALPLIRSIYKNDSRDKLIYIISSEDFNKEIFKDYNVECIMNCEKYCSNYVKDSIHWNHVTKDTMLRFHIFELPKDKYLYLDLDTIVVKDLSPLWDLDISETGIAFCEEQMYLDENPSIGCGFNAGVMLVDTNIFYFDWMLYNALDNLRRFNDQQILNIMVNQRYTHLEDKYNYMILSRHWYQIRYHRYKTFQNMTRGVLYLSVDPVIIHYTGRDKPWNSECHLFDKWRKFNESTSICNSNT